MTKPYLLPCKKCAIITRRKNTRPYLCSVCKNIWAKPHFWGSIKKEIIKRDDNKCTVCGDNERLQVHHRDGDRRNNDSQNLVTFCIQCHASLHRKNFEKPIEVVFGAFGKRLLYRSNKPNSTTHKDRTSRKRVPITRFYGNLY